MQVNSALMIHGAGGGGWEWDVWRRVFLAAGWRVSTPDLRPAAAGLAATTLDDYEAQVHAWIHAASPDVVVGASLGGLLALNVATQAQAAEDAGAKEKCYGVAKAGKNDCAANGQDRKSVV